MDPIIVKTKILKYNKRRMKLTEILKGIKGGVEYQSRGRQERREASSELGQIAHAELQQAQRIPDALRAGQILVDPNKIARMTRDKYVELIERNNSAGPDFSLGLIKVVRVQGNMEYADLPRHVAQLNYMHNPAEVGALLGNPELDWFNINIDQKHELIDRFMEQQRRRTPRVPKVR